VSFDTVAERSLNPTGATLPVPASIASDDVPDAARVSAVLNVSDGPDNVL
jgi:hypothetical protein